MKRIIDKHTFFFIRDDFTFDEETEIELDVPPAQGFYHPKWNGTEWVEGLSQEDIDELTKPVPQPPTAVERIEFLEQAIIFLSME